MTRKRVLLGLGVVSLGLVVSSVIYAFNAYQAGGPHRQMMREFIEFRIDKELNSLGLDENQRAKADAIVETIWQELDQGMADHEATGHMIMAELHRDTPNREALTNLIDNKIEHHRQTALKVLDQVLEFQQVLTSEQRNQLILRIEELHEQHRGHGPCMMDN